MDLKTIKYFYIGLLKESELGLIEIEKKDTNYNRIEMGPGDLEFNEDVLINMVEITFPQAKKCWGLLTHFGIWDSLNNGKLLTIGNLIQKRIIRKNDIAQFDINDIEISIESIGI